MATTDDPARRNFPERIGRYQIIERIGRGAMGVVYGARDGVMGRDVAVKVLITDLQNNPDIKTRFHREAEAAARLSHPNIITIFDVGEDGEHFYIVMELLRGAMLRDLLTQTGAVPIARKIDLMYQLSAGLEAAHSAAVYHRDIKPGNIFVRSDGILKILDFGVARLASSRVTGVGFIVGTPDYMAPEQVQGAVVDGRSDIFSVGGVFYFMLTGRKPFPAVELPTLFHQIQHEAPRPLLPEEAPAELAAIVMKALSKERDDRYQRCRDMMADLEHLREVHSLEVRRLPVATTRTTKATVRINPEAGSVSHTLSPRPADAGPSPEDTVDLQPASSSDATVAMTPPRTWIRRMSDHVDSAVSEWFGRFWRPAPSATPTQPEVRKR